MLLDLCSIRISWMNNLARLLHSWSNCLRTSQNFPTLFSFNFIALVVYFYDYFTVGRAVLLSCKLLGVFIHDFPSIASIFPYFPSSSLTWWSGLSISRAINHDFLTNNGGVPLLLDCCYYRVLCVLSFSSLQRLNAISLLTPQRVICAITRPKMWHRQKKIIIQKCPNWLRFVIEICPNSAVENCFFIMLKEWKAQWKNDSRTASACTKELRGGRRRGIAKPKHK